MPDQKSPALGSLRFAVVAALVAMPAPKTANAEIPLGPVLPRVHSGGTHARHKAATKTAPASLQTLCPVDGVDSDLDRVPDDKDACPKEPGVPNEDPKQNGCPEHFAGTAAGPAEVSFTGFSALPDGRSYIYVELTGPVAVAVSRNGGSVIYTMLDTKVPQRNNRNPLVTSEFVSSIASATLVADKKSKTASLVLKLNSDVEPQLHLLKRASGAVVEIDLPAPFVGCAPPKKMAN